MNQALLWLTGILAAALGAAVALFRKGGIYNPITNEPMPTPPTPMDCSEEVYKTAFSLLGQHLTLDDNVPEEQGCAEAVSTVLSRAGFKLPIQGFPLISSLEAWMLQNGFKQANNASQGYIVVGRNGTNAHVGICGKEWIMSNTSYDDPALQLVKGEFQANYRYPNFKVAFPQVTFYVPYI